MSDKKSLRIYPAQPLIESPVRDGIYAAQDQRKSVSAQSWVQYPKIKNSIPKGSRRPQARARQNMPPTPCFGPPRGGYHLLQDATPIRSSHLASPSSSVFIRVHPWFTNLQKIMGIRPKSGRLAPKKSYFLSVPSFSNALPKRMIIHAPNDNTIAAATRPVTTSQRCWPDKWRNGNTIHHRPGNNKARHAFTISLRAGGRLNGGQILRQK
jgi:hypothetical protein